MYGLQSDRSTSPSPAVFARRRRHRGTRAADQLCASGISPPKSAESGSQDRTTGKGYGISGTFRTWIRFYVRSTLTVAATVLILRDFARLTHGYHRSGSDAHRRYGRPQLPPAAPTTYHTCATSVEHLSQVS